MINSITLTDFKCFSRHKVSLKGLTVLAGANSAGKSTVLQALLLSRIAYQNYTRQSNSTEGLKVHLNGPFLLELGNTLEVVRRGKKIEDSFFQFEIEGSEGEKLSIKFSADRSNTNTYHVNVAELNVIGNFSLINSRFYYLSAERIGPRLNYTFEPQNYPHVGWRGERTFQLLSGENLPVEHERCFKEDQPGETLFYQTRKWLDYIIPGSNFDNAVLVGKSRIIEGTFGQSMPTNVGFGISYSLPIIVNGLIANKNSIFLIENPEAHLHPLGQSRVGRFLAQIASTGVQILLETHSDHVINGIRLATLSEQVAHADIIVNFFSRDSEGKPITKPIDINAMGDLTTYPKGFFDQEQKDIAAITKLKLSK
jgi:predicted ATPase